MKTIKLAVLSACIFAAMTLSTKAAEVSVGVTIRVESDFHEPLTPYGRWEVVGTYGRCWIPTRVEADWRPYCNGHWVRTDEGWYWDSDEPWAWATYHTMVAGISMHNWAGIGSHRRNGRLRGFPGIMEVATSVGHRYTRQHGSEEAVSWK